MTVIKCTSCTGEKQTNVFVTARTHEEHDWIHCPYCGEPGYLKMNPDQRFYNEGFI